MTKVLENNICKINYSSSLYKLAKDTIVLLEQKIKEYQLLFDVKMDEKFIVNYFDKIDDFRDFIYEIRKENISLPSYATGTYDNGMINAYIAPKVQMESRYTASHELFHILYMKYILANDYSKRIVWYDEGMAQFVSGEKDYLEKNDNFLKFYFKVKEQTKIIPDMNTIEHGTSFCNDDYNGYDLSYLAIRYLSEILNRKQFIELMSQFSNIKTLGNDIILKMFKYYDKKLEKRITKI